MASGAVKRGAYVRVAQKSDVPAIKLLIEGLADYEKLSDECHATEDSLESTLFRQPPFEGTTVLILELGPLKAELSLKEEGGIVDVYKEVSLNKVDESEDATFVSSKDERRTIVGFTLFFPKYWTNMAKNGLYIGDLYVRGAYRRQGLGTILLKTVAQQAVKRGLARVEWNVLDWNVNAISFYESMGAVVMPAWRTCRLSGDKLQAHAE